MPRRLLGRHSEISPAFPARCFLCALCANFANFAVKSFLISFFLLCPIAHSQNDSRIPPEVRHPSAYINPIPKPPDFSSAMLWGIAIADRRVPGHEHAQVKIAHTQFSCRVDGKDILLNDDRGSLRGGLYTRFPWFATDAHDPIPLSYSSGLRIVILKIGLRPDRVWHFWAASPRAEIPAGHLEGCTVKARVRISRGALLQVGFDYWRNSTIGYGPGGNNHEAGASDWYFPSDNWQDATFTDIKQ